MKDNSVAMIISRGYALRTGYYYRVNRDKKLFESLGYEVDLILIGSHNVNDNSINYKFNFIEFYNLIKILNRYNYIVCENIGVALFISILKRLLLIKLRLKLILIYHGSLDELKHYKFYYIKKLLYENTEKYVLNNFNGVVVVSNVFERYLLNKYNNPHSKIITIPNYPDQDFLDRLNEVLNEKSIRKKLNLPIDKTIYTYSGNTQPWQNLDYMIDLYQSIYKNNTKAFFVFLTLNKEELLEKIGNKLHPSSYLIRTVENQDIPKYLVASDLLVVLRKKDKINRVACPTKAIEYLLSQRPLLISSGLGDISSIVKTQNNGIVINMEKEINEIAIEIVNTNLDNLNKKSLEFTIPLTFQQAKIQMKNFLESINNEI